MKRVQTIRKLRRWNNNINNKIIALRRAAKIYIIIGWFNKISIATLTTTLIAINSFNITDDFIELLIIVMVLQIILALYTAIEAAINPSKLASQCSICWKQYMELSKELAIMIDDLDKNDLENNDLNSNIVDYSDNSYEKYTNLTLLYSTKEQLILNVEPMIFFSTTNKTAINIE